jgi:uncharacterized protein YyaL (SSP411 family)
MNALHKETSPYLLQHAHNPVNWYPWGQEALQKALTEDKPILVSIGYSACHWCHVMERESFESSDIAGIMNEHFVCIKVDREERPDVDAIYMDALHSMGLRGGWPLNVFLMPNQKPFYGGTYFKPAQWKQILQNIATAFQNNRSELEESAQEFAEHLNSSEIRKYGLMPQQQANTLSDLEQMYATIAPNFDKRLGGIDKAPKFPMPSIWRFLLRYSHFTQDLQALSQLHLTLQKMAFGGIYDQIGGGFARYSVDGEWFCPHFEKMLYDNAQLLSLYAEAYQFSKNEIYKEICYEIISFVTRELQAHAGGFYSALDADSEGEEGKFYIWKKRHLQDILGEDTELFCKYYNVSSQGNWEYGNNILYKNDTDEDFASKNQITPETLKEKVSEWKQLLLAERSKKVRPGLDDKILTSWNGLMIKGLVDAYRVFGEKSFWELAQKHTEFLLEKMLDKQEGFLYHTFSYKDQTPKQKGFLEDYACLIEALVALYQASFENKYLFLAQKLTDYTLNHFYDPEEGMFFFTDATAENLITRKKEIFDNVIPASNSIMAQNLYWLGILLDRNDYKETSTTMLSQMRRILLKQVEYACNWAVLFSQTIQPTAEIALVGSEAHNLRKELDRHFLPNKVVVGTLETENEIPLLEQRTALQGKTTIYVCFDKTCQLPVFSVEDALKMLN